MKPNFKRYLLQDLLLNPNYSSNRARGREFARMTGINSATAQTQIFRMSRRYSGRIHCRRSAEAPPTTNQPFHVYCIECATPNHFYVGQTRHLNERITKHKLGKGAKFTQRHGFINWYPITSVSTRVEALKLEFLLWQVLRKKGIIAGGY